MTRIQITENAQVVASVIGAYGDEILTITREEMQGGMERAAVRGRTYPSELPGQQYVRTGILGKNTKAFIPAGTGIRVGVESKAVQMGKHYSSYPLGDERGQGQALIHSGRWELLRVAVDEELAVAVKNIANRLQELASRLGIAK